MSCPICDEGLVTRERTSAAGKPVLESVFCGCVVGRLAMDRATADERERQAMVMRELKPQHTLRDTLIERRDEFDASSVLWTPLPPSYRYATASLILPEDMLADHQLVHIGYVHDEARRLEVWAMSDGRYRSLGEVQTREDAAALLLAYYLEGGEDAREDVYRHAVDQVKRGAVDADGCVRVPASLVRAPA